MRGGTARFNSRRDALQVSTADVTPTPPAGALAPTAPPLPDRAACPRLVWHNGVARLLPGASPPKSKMRQRVSKAHLSRDSRLHCVEQIRRPPAPQPALPRRPPRLLPAALRAPSCCTSGKPLIYYRSRGSCLPACQWDALEVGRAPCRRRF